MGYDFVLGEDTFVVHPARDRGASALSIDGRAVEARLREGLARGERILEIDGRRERLFVASRGDTHFIQWRGQTYRVDAVNALERARRAAEPTGGGDLIRAPMPGTVVGVSVASGEEVAAGDLLMTIESMKLQTAITASHPARVLGIDRSAGATFDQGDVLIRLEPLEPDAGSDEEGGRDQ